MPGSTIWSYLAADDPALAASIQVGWMAVFENMLPLELTLDQLPQMLRRGDRMLSLTYRALPDAYGIDRLLIVVSDSTAEHERDAANATQQELSLLMRRLVKDTAAVEEFFDDGFALVETIERSAVEPDLVLLRRSLHTLKGNSGFFGLTRFATLLHEIESKLLEQETVPDGAIGPLVAAWEDIAIAVSPFLGSRCDVVDVSKSDLERLITSARSRSPAEIVEQLESLRQESVERRLGRLAQQARALAVDLGKELEVKATSSGERWDGDRFAPFWSAVVHVLRNAVDHGVETRAERVRQGKTPRGQLTLRVEETPFARIFEIEDDGCGIDWTRLRARASSMDASAAVKTSELTDVDLLFVDGLSTRESVTELSGRGVGLAATRAACEGLGGSIVVESKLGQGTLFRFTFPRCAAENRQQSAA